MSHEFEHPAEDVFDAWLTPEFIRQWMRAALDESMPGTRMLEFSVTTEFGGTFTFTDTRDNDETPPTGTYLEIERPHRLVFTWLPDSGRHLHHRAHLYRLPTHAGPRDGRPMDEPPIKDPSCMATHNRTLDARPS
jgi:uncharacterized protein YndB with AHSA1/START domain